MITAVFMRLERYPAAALKILEQALPGLSSTGTFSILRDAARSPEQNMTQFLEAFESADCNVQAAAAKEALVAVKRGSQLVEEALLGYVRALKFPAGCDDFVRSLAANHAVGILAEAGSRSAKE